MQEDFENDFEDSQDENSETATVARAPLPKKGEVIGTLDQRLGGNKMMINCVDGKQRNCRVPGSFPAVGAYNPFFG